MRICRGGPQEILRKKAILNIFAKFIVRHFLYGTLDQEPLFNKVEKKHKDLNFSVNFVIFLKHTTYRTFFSGNKCQY